MKGGKNLRDLQAAKKEDDKDTWVRPQNCVICHEKMRGPYARWNDDWVCSKVCNEKQIQLMKEKIHASILSRGGQPP